MTPEERAFWEAIYLGPQQETTRQVFADWLEERGLDPDLQVWLRRPYVIEGELRTEFATIFALHYQSPSLPDWAYLRFYKQPPVKSRVPLWPFRPEHIRLVWLQTWPNLSLPGSRDEEGRLVGKLWDGRFFLLVCPGARRNALPSRVYVAATRQELKGKLRWREKMELDLV